MRLLLSFLLVAGLCLAQVSRADRFSNNSFELTGAAHVTAAVSGNVTTSAGGVMTVNTAAVHGLVAGDRATLTSCATGGLNADWTIATVPTTSSFTVTGTGVNNANSASCVLQSWKVLATYTGYVTSVIITNNSSSTRTVNLTDLSTSCSGAPCRVGLPKDCSILANTSFILPLQWIRAGSGMRISASGADVEYRIVGSR